MSCCSYSNNDERLGHKELTLQGKKMEIGIVRQTKQNAKFFLDDLEDLNSGPRCAELGTMTRKSFVPSKLR